MAYVKYIDCILNIVLKMLSEAFLCRKCAVKEKNEKGLLKKREHVVLDTPPDDRTRVLCVIYCNTP